MRFKEQESKRHTKAGTASAIPLWADIQVHQKSMTPVGVTTSYTHLPQKSTPCCRSPWTIKGTLPDPACERRVARSTVIRHFESIWCYVFAWRLQPMETFYETAMLKQRALVGSICSATIFRSRTPACQMLWRHIRCGSCGHSSTWGSMSGGSRSSIRSSGGE
jgi:hypothetical protein